MKKLLDFLICSMMFLMMFIVFVFIIVLYISGEHQLSYITMFIYIFYILTELILIDKFFANISKLGLGTILSLTYIFIFIYIVWIKN